MHGAAPESGADAGRRWKALAALAALAVLLHASALGGFEWGWPQREAPRLPAPAMQVRAVVPVSRVSVFTEPMPAAAPVRIEPVAVAPPPAPKPAVPAARPVAPVEVPAVQVVATAPVVSPAPPAWSPPTPAPAAAEPAAAPAEETVPTYRTQLPPAVTLRYDMQRGGLRGNGELQWRPGADRYELKLEGRVAGLTILTQVSQGGFDAAGIAPQRFTDRRIRRPLTAANFQREAGKITFSGPATEFALHEGTQDRLSWMMQLAAIVAAEPALRSAGATVVMRVVGAHADASVWAFRCIGREPVDTAGGAVDAIKYLREPHDLHDTTVQVWLDPARHFLPVHATQKSGPGDEGFALRLREIVAAP